MAPQNDKAENNRHTVDLNGGFTAQDLPISREKRPKSADTASTLSDYCLKWLFDPTRRDHLPIEEQLEHYTQRDLRKVKVYKIAASLWGAPESRKRRIIAPRMAKLVNQRDINVGPCTSPLTNSELRPQKPPVKGPTPEEVAAREEEERKLKYKSWMAERKKFRSDLENMGLSEEWLARKPDKSALERRVLRRMIDERRPKKVSTPRVEEDDLAGVLADDSPTVKRPSPLAIGIIEQFLREHRVRLIDLFSAGDKDKSWTLSRAEFKDAVKEANIPLSDVMLEDLVLALDHDMNDELDYRELARGMGLWRKEKREAKRKMAKRGVQRTPEEIARLVGYESPLETFRSSYSASTGRQTADSYNQPIRDEHGESLPGTSRRENTGSPKGRIKSAVSIMSSGSSQYLEPPEPDLRPEQKILSSDEAMVDLRKRDRAALARLTGKGNQKTSMSPDRRTKKRQTSFADENCPIKTGDAAIDSHNAPSTLGGETAHMVDKFRQLKLREYNDIVKICRLNNIPLTEDLLKKVLLYPPDKPHSQIKKKIRQPGDGQTLVSQTFADPPKRPRTPLQERLKDRIKVTKSGQLFVDSRHKYPNSFKCEAKSSRMNLSTGKAFIRRQVDCWMTFEEYDALTKHLAVRYSKLHGHTDDNAFWPGHLLDKIQLCMPQTEPKSNSVFTQVRPPKKAYPQQVDQPGSWKVSDFGYIQYGN